MPVVPAPTPAYRTDLATHLIVAAITALALGLRLWGLAFGEGQPRARPDEELYLGPAIRMFDGNLDPGLLWYGFTEGFCLVLHAALRVQTALLAWRHGMEVHLGCLFAMRPTDVLLTGRYLSVAFGVATILPCAVVARRLVTPARARTAGVVAMLLLAVNYLHGRDSHFAVPDAALTFALAGAMAGAVRLVEEGRTRDALAGAVCTGAAAALKWTGLFMVPVLASALVLTIARFRRDRPLRRVAVMGAALALAGVTFLVLDPHVIHEIPETLSGLRSHAMRYGDEALGHLQDPSVDLGRGFWFHARVTLPIAFGWFGFAAAGLGLVVSFVHRPHAAWVCALFLASLYGAALGPTRMLFVRYCMPVLPIVAALTAAGLVQGVGWVAGRLRSRHAPALILAAAIAAAAIPPAVRLVRADVRLARADTRTLAADWFRTHLRPGETVVPFIAYSSVYAVPAEGSAACNAVLPPVLRAEVTPMPPLTEPWTPLVGRGRSGWGAIAEHALIDYWSMPGLKAADGAYVAVGQPLLSGGKPSLLRGAEAPDPACFDEVARFGPGRPGVTAVYDLFDQFYLPYAGFEGVERPGPEVTIYRNRCARKRS